MYVGDTHLHGLHHLVNEVVDNSIDEAMAGFGHSIHVIIDVDGSISVADDGRGIPIDIYADTGKGALEVVMTTVHAGGKFDHQTYKVSGGLHGVGLTAVNALSEWLQAEVRRDGRLWRQDFEKGKATSELYVVAATKTTGTKISFLPDTTIFPGLSFDADILEKRLRELAYLNKGVKIRLTDQRGPDPRDVEFVSTVGLIEFVAYLNRAQTVLHSPIVLAGRDNERGVAVEVALQYNDSISEMVVSYCNNIHTIEGGTHLTGFRIALTRTLNQYAKSAASAKTKDLTITGRGFQRGAHGDHQRPCARSPVREPNQDQTSATATLRGSRQGSSASGCSSSSKTTLRQQANCSQGTALLPGEAARKARSLFVTERCPFQWRIARQADGLYYS